MWSGLSCTTGHLMSKCTNAPSLLLTSQLVRYPVKWERRESVRARIRNKFELVHMDTWRIIKWRKSMSTWITNCLKSLQTSYQQCCVLLICVIPYQQCCTILICVIPYQQCCIILICVIPYQQCCILLICVIPYQQCFIHFVCVIPVVSAKYVTIKQSISLCTAFYCRNIKSYMFRQYAPNIIRLQVYFLYTSETCSLMIAVSYSRNV